MNTLLGYLRQAGTAVRFLALATLVLGLLYPVAIFGLGQVIAPAQANGSILKDPAGNPVASARLVQTSADEKGVQDLK
jgi:K+-transporting ATPase ATPase C chain